MNVALCVSESENQVKSGGVANNVMSTVSAPTRALLQLSLVKGVGPATLKKVAAIPGFYELSRAELEDKLPQLRKHTSAPGVWDRAAEQCELQIEEALKHQARILSGVDSEYPALLARTSDDPFLLFVQGKLASEPAKSVAIIGTREPTQHGEQITERITAFFAEQSWSVVSGLAIGCDSIAHRTALEVGGHTVAVLAHGLHMIAPARHKDLAADILSSGGALVTEYKFGQDVQKQQFVKRDRIQAGLAQGVVMIQSDVVGGSLHATRASLEYKRWIAVPAPTDRDRENGELKVQANLVIAEGAEVERLELLRCDRSDLVRVHVLRSRQDYLHLISDHEPHGPIGSQAASDAAHPASLETLDQVQAELDSEEVPLPPLQRAFVYDTSPEAIRARARYVAGKLKEVDVMLQCMTDPTTAITPIETRLELEVALLQMRELATAAKRLDDSDSELRDNIGRFARQVLVAVASMGLQGADSPDSQRNPLRAREEYLRSEETFKSFCVALDAFLNKRNHAPQT